MISELSGEGLEVMTVPFRLGFLWVPGKVSNPTTDIPGTGNPTSSNISSFFFFSDSSHLPCVEWRHISI